MKKKIIIIFVLLPFVALFAIKATQYIQSKNQPKLQTYTAFNDVEENSESNDVVSDDKLKEMEKETNKKAKNAINDLTIYDDSFENKISNYNSDYFGEHYAAFFKDNEFQKISAKNYLNEVLSKTEIKRAYLVTLKDKNDEEYYLRITLVFKYSEKEWNISYSECSKEFYSKEVFDVKYNEYSKSLIFCKKGETEKIEEMYEDVQSEVD